MNDIERASFRITRGRITEGSFEMFQIKHHPKYISNSQDIEEALRSDAIELPIIEVLRTIRLDDQHPKAALAPLKLILPCSSKPRHFSEDFPHTGNTHPSGRFRH
jgi:hypothetical protein